MYQLTSLTVEITNQCNAKCIHCIVDAANAREDELTTAQIMKLIEDTADLGCKNITFTGGEPFLRKEWPLFLQKAKSLGMTVVFMTNGLMLNDKTIETLANFGGIALGISLDGADSQTHDYIRGVPGIFDNLMKVIPKLLEKKIYTALATTVMKSNVNRLDEIKNLVLDLKVPSWQVQIVKPANRLAQEELLSEEEYYQIAQKIAGYRREYLHIMDIGEADCIGYNSVLSKDLYWNQWRGCECGLYIASIASNGDVKGCPNMDATEGNIKTRPFKEIWNDHNSFRYNRLPNVDDLKGFCNECENKYVCRGGCPVNPVTPKGSAYCLHKIEVCGCDE